MGCDIHAVIEGSAGSRRSELSYWYGILQVPIERYYPLFARLADVRNEEYDHKDWIQPLSLPKGIPSNASSLTKELFEKIGSDSHSHSWLSWHELHNLQAEFKQYPFYRIMQIYAERYADLRLVFCFDN